MEIVADPLGAGGVEHTGSRSHPDNSRFFLGGCRKGNPFYRCFRKALISFLLAGQ